MLYIVGTPIGNLKDITFRALETLKQVDTIIVESYHDSSKLLRHFEIEQKKIIKYNDRNKNRSIPGIIELLKTSDAAFITSAGMPSISDPGTDLVATCIAENITVVPIPGVSAVSTLISVSPFSIKRHIFIGFMPRTVSKIKKLVHSYLEQDSLLVFFESPFRLVKTLTLLADEYPHCSIIVGKEMTKKFETFMHGDIQTVLAKIKENAKLQKGEFTIGITITS